MAQAVDQAMILGSADILLTELLALLTPRQAAVLAQVAVCRAPMTLDDLAFTFSPGPGPAGTGRRRGQPAGPGGAAGGHRPAGRPHLARTGPGHRDAPVDRRAGHPPRRRVTRSALHERALAMRLRRFEQHRGSYDDLLDIPRHLAALHRYDDIAGIAGQAARMLPGTLATVAYLAEVRPLIPPAERAWILVADLEVQALLSAGNLPAATRQLEAIHQQVRDPRRRRPGQHRMAARPVRQPHQARGRGGRGRGPDRRPRPLPGRPGHPGQARRRRPRQHPVAARPVRQPQQARGGGGRGRGPDRRPRPLPGRPRHRRTAGRRRPRQHRMAARPVRQPQQARGRGGRGRGPDRRPRPLPGRPGHRRPAGRRRPRQHRMAARPVRQPRKARERGGRGRGPDRRPRPLPGRPGHPRSGSPPPTPPTASGSATCPSAATSSGTWQTRPGT